jgi:hypothetical protein
LREGTDFFFFCMMKSPCCVTSPAPRTAQRHSRTVHRQRDIAYLLRDWSSPLQSVLQDKCLPLQASRNTPARTMQKLRHHHILDRAKSFLYCWTHQAPDATFAGIKPDDLATETARAENARKDVLAAEVALRAQRHTRNQADRRLAGMLRRFARGVCAHPDYGDDSPFYRALGFVPHSENRSGRPRKPR